MNLFADIQNLCVSSHIDNIKRKLVLELLNQRADIGIVELDDTARENMTHGLHLGSEKKAFLIDSASVVLRTG